MDILDVELSLSLSLSLLLSLCLCVSLSSSVSVTTNEDLVRSVGSTARHQAKEDSMLCTPSQSLASWKSTPLFFQKAAKIHSPWHLPHAKMTPAVVGPQYYAVQSLSGKTSRGHISPGTEQCSLRLAFQKPLRMTAGPLHSPCRGGSVTLTANGDMFTLVRG